MPANVRKPTAPPSRDDIADRDRWEAVAAGSLATVQAAAEKWRTGLAAFVTLVTGSLFVAGPEAAADVDRGWLVLLTALAAGGLALAIGGLWLALRAAAGAPGKVGYQAVVSAYGGIRQFEIVSAEGAAESLRWAKVVIALALSLLGAAAFVLWWAPAMPSSPPAHVSVQTGDESVCGKLLSGDDQTLRLSISGESTPRSFRFADVQNVSVVETCPD